MHVGGGFNALIRNLLVNAEAPVPQLILNQSIKMLVANGWAEEMGLPGRQGDTRGGKEISHISEGERDTGHVRTRME